LKSSVRNRREGREANTGEFYRRPETDWRSRKIQERTGWGVKEEKLRKRRHAEWAAKACLIQSKKAKGRKRGEKGESETFISRKRFYGVNKTEK